MVADCPAIIMKLSSGFLLNKVMGRTSTVDDDININEGGLRYLTLVTQYSITLPYLGDR